MLNGFLFSLAVSAALGFLSGLGTGGGSLLILWLTAVLGTDPVTARCINLMFFLPSAIAASLFHRKQGLLDIKRLLPGILAGCLGAGIGTLIGRGLDLDLMKKLFGGLLILTGVRELLCKEEAGK